VTGALEAFIDQHRVVVHLGAHKTATTFLQNSLNAARADLAVAGCQLLLPVDLRGQEQVRRVAPWNGPDRRRAVQAGTQAALRALIEEAAGAPGTRRVVLSEESLIGSSHSNLTSAALYPDFADNLRLFPRALDHPNVTFLFAVREYGAFFSSNLTTTARRGKLFNTEDLRARLPRLPRRWPDILGELRVAFPFARLRTWRYEDFRDLTGAVFDALTGQAVPRVEGRVNETLSQPAMETLWAQADADGAVPEPKRAVKDALAQYPVGSENPPFSLWSATQAAEFKAAYDADWAEIVKLAPRDILRV